MSKVLAKSKHGEKIATHTKCVLRRAAFDRGEGFDLEKISDSFSTELAFQEFHDCKMASIKLHAKQIAQVSQTPEGIVNGISAAYRAEHEAYITHLEKAVFARKASLRESQTDQALSVLKFPSQHIVDLIKLEVPARDEDATEQLASKTLQAALATCVETNMAMLLGADAAEDHETSSCC